MLTRNICLSIIKDLAKRLKLNAKINDTSNYEYNSFTICDVSKVYLKSEILGIIYDVFDKYQKVLPIEGLMRSANFKAKDLTLDLGLNTKLSNYCSHIGAMLYDEFYAGNNDASCITVDISHVTIDAYHTTGSITVSVSANKDFKG